VTSAGADVPAAIQVRGVSKRFQLFSERPNNIKEMFVRRRVRPRSQEFWALRDVSFDIPKGSTFGLIGHNGSGKSTLLKLVAGIHRPSSGSVVVDGRISAMLELGAGFHPELSGRENIYLNGAILGMTRRQISASMDAIIEFSGLAEFIDSPVKVYSSGMYVRLGFSIAVNLDPEILVIDEVIAVGDEEFQRRCFDHLANLRRRGVTVVLVSHSLGLVQSLCDHVVWLDHGRLRMAGPAAEVTQAYLKEVNEAELLPSRDPSTVPEDHRPGSHEVVVTDVQFLAGEDRQPHRALAGETLVVRVHYDARQPVFDPVVGLAFHTDNDVYVSGMNSREGDLQLGRVSGRGFVDVDLGPCPLNPGNYMVTAAMTDWSLAHRYDFWDHGFELTVRPGARSEGNGLVALTGAWSSGGTARDVIGQETELAEQPDPGPDLAVGSVAADLARGPRA
jgi:lipopolysaccharide transport system ATP-binding protein